MKHFSWKLLSVVLAMILGIGISAKAQDVNYVVVENYLEPFAKTNVSGSSSWGDPSGPFVPPLGWDALPVVWQPNSSTYKVSYTASSSGKEGICIGNTSTQILSAYVNGAYQYNEVYDLLITPRVKGSLNFYLKPSSTSYDAFASFFRMHRQEDGTFTFDAVADSIAWTPAEMTSTSAWVEQNLTLPGDDYEYIGIRLWRMYIDEVGASSALLPETKTVNWASSAAAMEGYNQYDVKANAEGYATFGIRQNLTNTGNVPIPAGHKAKLMRAISTGTPYIVADEPLAEVDLPQLAPGESQDIEIEATFQVPDDVAADSNGKIRFRIDFWEDYTGVEHTSSSDRSQVGVGLWIEVVPYEGIMQISYDFINASNVQTSKTFEATTKPINYGSFRGSKSRDFKVKNIGAADLVINSAEMPSWITLTGIDFPVTVEAGETLVVPVEIGGDTGAKKGQVKFLYEGMAVSDFIPVMGEVIGEEEYFADFEADNALDEWYAPSGSTSWSIYSYSNSERNSNNDIWTIEPGINNKALRNGRNEEVGHAIYSPKLTFAEGDSIVFYAAKLQNGGSYVRVKVDYSSDRSDWEPLANITVSNEDPNQEFYYTSSQTTSGQNIFKRFAFPMPAGDYYISLTSGYTLVDNFHGGQLAEVGLDLISESASAGEERITNHPLTFTASFKNLTPTEVPAEGQEVALYANGEKVATATSQAIPAFGTVDYDFTYTPHTAGATTLYAAVTVEEETFNSPKVELTIFEEKLENKARIGEFSFKSNGEYETAQNEPIKTYNYSSKSEFIYTADDLKDVEGSLITKISYPYYSQDKSGVYSKVLNIWMENTDQVEPSKNEDDVYVFTDTETMDNVFSAVDFYYKGGNGSATDLKELEFVLDTPFLYDGGNLRVVVEATKDPVTDTNGGYLYQYFAQDKHEEKADRIALYKFSDSSYSTYVTTKASSENAFPIINIYTQKNVPPVTGTVKDTDGNAVVGASVKAVSGDVEYSTVSGEEGAWELVIIQGDLDYTLCVTAEGYDDYSGTLDKNGVNEVCLTKPVIAEPEIPEGWQKVQNYLEKFSNNSVKSSRPNVGNENVADDDPLGWNHQSGDVVRGSTTKSISYSTLASGKDGYAIGASNTWKGKFYNPEEDYEIFDYLVTPLVKGDLKFYLRRNNASNPMAFELYRMTKKEDGSFEAGELLAQYSDEELKEVLTSNDVWNEYTVNIGDALGYVGFRMQYLYLDEVSADEAVIPVKKSITLGSPVYSEGYSYKINATADGKWKVGAEIPVTNASNVPLKAEEEGDNYTVSLVRVKSTANPYTFVELVSVPLPDLEVGETKTVKVEGEFDIPEDVTLDSSYGYYRFRLDFVENYTGKELNKALPSWAEVTPHVSMLEIRYDKYTSKSNSEDTKVDATKSINFGVFRGEREIEFRLRNRGAATLTFEGVEKPDYVEIVDMPESVEVDKSATIKVKVGGTPGLKSGSVKFLTNGTPMVDEIPFVAEVAGEDEFFSNFETEDDFAQWYTPDASTNWKRLEYDSTERNYTDIEYNFNDFRLENDRQTPLQHILSPKMAFQQGDSISFYASKKTKTGDDVKLVVRYSADRTEWEELGTIVVNNPDNLDLQFDSSEKKMKRFAFEMPEGEYYVSLGAGYVNVDNFRGGTPVAVDYDIAPVSAEAGKTRTVNNPLGFTATFRNLLSEEIPAEDQSVSLYADGVVVATAEPQDIAGVSNVTYEFSYVPHVAGPVSLYAEIQIGEYAVASATLDVAVAAESSSVANRIGDVKDSNAAIPLSLNYNNSRSEVIYTAEVLSEMKGDKIMQISYPYYKTNEEQTGNVKIWLENTDEETVGETLTNTENWTPVVDIVGYNFVPGGSNTSDMVEMVFVLDTPFEYTGSNLRVIIEKMGSDYKSVNFGVDNTTGISTRYYRNDTESTYLNNRYGKGEVSKNMPVVTLYTELEIAPVVGTVKTSEGEAVEGASVKAVSGDVIYEAVTDAEGAWSMTIFQRGLDYTVTAYSEELGSSEPTALSFTESNDLVIEVEAEEEEVVAPANGSYTAAQREDHQGYFDITITWTLAEALTRAASTEDYTFNVYLNGQLHNEEAVEGYEYTLEDVIQGDHEISIKSVSPTGKESEAHVIYVVGDTLGIFGVGVDGEEYRYFDLNGVEIHTDRLENGIYIRVSGNKAEKVLVNK